MNVSITEKHIDRYDDPTVTHAIEAALVVVEARVGVDAANLLRSYIAGLQGRVRALELLDDYSDASADGIERYDDALCNGREHEN